MAYDRATHRQFWQEIRRAWERIAKTPGGPMGWIITFVQQNLEALTPSEWNLLAFEVAAFGFKFPAHTGLGALHQEEVWSVRLFQEERRLIASLPSRKEGLELQATLRSHLTDWFATKRLAVSFPKVTIEIAEEHFPEVNRTLVLAAVTMPHVAKRFEYCFAYLFAGQAENVRRCQDCSRIFLAKRHDQLYCTVRCQTRVASRKWRAEHLPQAGTGKQQQSRRRSPMKRSRSVPGGGTHGT